MKRQEKVPHPFVKWAGGKRQLVEELLRRTPGGYGTYYEPMVGGGALLFALKPDNAVIADINEELINAYKVIRDHVEELIEDLRQHKNERDYYYWIRALDPDDLTLVQRASRFIYLNKTCYNGLWRVNSRGQFNVPFGRYKNPKIVDEANLRAASKFLRGVRILLADFEEAVKDAQPGDFVYFDPPYVPLSDTAYFTSYTKDRFGPEQQKRLARVFRRLAQRGVYVMLSNSDTSLVHELYADFYIQVVKANRFINSKASKRTGFTEVIVTNYENCA